MYSIISELIKQKVLKNVKSAYGGSFRIIAETAEQLGTADVFCDNNDNCDHQPSQHNPGANTINPQPFTVDEQDATLILSPTNKIAPAIA